MQARLSAAWYSNAWWLWLLWPLSLLYGVLFAWHRRRAQQRGRHQSGVPVIVVGNLTAGGTGKTPLCLALARHYTGQGLRVVLVSRGYGGQAVTHPLLVQPGTDPREAGDEAVLLAQASGCAVVVDPDRVRAVRHAAQTLQAQLIISDDGLQHHALQAQVELAVIDGDRGLGNGLLLPAGPLREAATRLGQVTAVISNGPLQRPLPVLPRQLFTMTLAPLALRNLVSGERLDFTAWQTRYGQATPAHAIAGIGNPGRFFASLQLAGFVIMPHAFDDHHAYQAHELAFAADAPLLMTAKDAVKCCGFAGTHWWALDVEAQLPAAFFALLDSTLNP